MRFVTSLSFVIAVLVISEGLSSSGLPNNNSIAELGATIVINDEGGCQELCNNITSCSEDPHHHGSYCKFWQSPPVCFGMYQNVSATATNGTLSEDLNAQVCFQPNDPGCNDIALPPITCPTQTNTTCARICQETPDCLNDQHHAGSFCKEDMNVCFGLYWSSSDQTEACYAPTDNSTCPTEFPISCSGGHTFTTTIAPSTASSETPGESTTRQTSTEQSPTSTQEPTSSSTSQSTSSQTSE